MRATARRTARPTWTRSHAVCTRHALRAYPTRRHRPSVLQPSTNVRTRVYEVAGRRRDGHPRETTRHWPLTYGRRARSRLALAVDKFFFSVAPSFAPTTERDYVFDRSLNRRVDGRRTALPESQRCRHCFFLLLYRIIVLQFPLKNQRLQFTKIVTAAFRPSDSRLLFSAVQIVSVFQFPIVHLPALTLFSLFNPNRIRLMVWNESSLAPSRIFKFFS